MPVPDNKDDLVFPPRHDKTAYELQLENKHLKDLLANQDKEIEELRDLLEECKNIVAHDLWSRAQFSDGQVVEKDNLLTRINAVLGESEEFRNE